MGGMLVTLDYAGRLDIKSRAGEPSLIFHPALKTEPSEASSGPAFQKTRRREEGGGGEKIFGTCHVNLQSWNPGLLSSFPCLAWYPERRVGVGYRMSLCDGKVVLRYEPRRNTSRRGKCWNGAG